MVSWMNLRTWDGHGMKARPVLLHKDITEELTADLSVEGKLMRFVDRSSYCFAMSLITCSMRSFNLVADFTSHSQMMIRDQPIC